MFHGWTPFLLSFSSLCLRHPLSFHNLHPLSSALHLPPRFCPIHSCGSPTAQPIPMSNHRFLFLGSDPTVFRPFILCSPSQYLSLGPLLLSLSSLTLGLYISTLLCSIALFKHRSISQPPPVSFSILCGSSVIEESLVVKNLLFQFCFAPFLCLCQINPLLFISEAGIPAFIASFLSGSFFSRAFKPPLPGVDSSAPVTRGCLPKVW